MRTETRELLAWVAGEPRSYPEAMEVWRTSCPQHSVWEDALEDRLVEVVRRGTRTVVQLTPAGLSALGAE